MKKNAYLVNILLAAELFVLCLTAVIIRTYTPSAIFPRFDIPFFVLLSVIPFTAEYYLSPSRHHDPIVTILLAGLTFCLLPYAAGIDPEMSAWMLFTVSSAVFGTTMCYDGALIMAAYHAISCGQTESAENVWDTALPYLQSVPSTGDALAEDFTSVCTFTTAELAAALADTPHVQLSGDAAGWLGEIERTQAGTVKRLTIGQVGFTGRELRKLLGLRSAAFDATYKDGVFTFTVQGFGHGVGMSQYGAGYLARQGMRYDEILRYYYTGVTLRND